MKILIDVKFNVNKKQNLKLMKAFIDPVICQVSFSIFKAEGSQANQDNSSSTLIKNLVYKVYF